MSAPPTSRFRFVTLAKTVAKLVALLDFVEGFANVRPLDDVSPRSFLAATKDNAPRARRRRRFRATPDDDDDDVDVDVDDVDVDVDVDVDEVSDVELLLACRAHLSRRKRLEWTLGEARKARRRGAGASIDYYYYRDDDDFGNAERRGMVENENERGRGYFWDDPDELVYLRKKHRDETSDDDDDDDDDDRASSLYLDDEGFLSYPSGPSEERGRRSEAAKRTWSDPVFREHWRARRWGPRHVPPTAAERSLARRAANLPLELLEDPSLLASLTEDEVRNAVATYRRSNASRSSKRRRRARRNDDDDEEVVVLASRDGDENRTAWELANNEEGLRERRRQRSERARIAYQTRLANEAKRKKEDETETETAVDKSSTNDAATAESSTKIRFSVASSSLSTSSPYDKAMASMEASLDRGDLPRKTDIHMILSIGRLAGRKKLFLRALKERFGLFGKCVPTETDPDVLRFAVNCSVGTLGTFLLTKIEEAEKAEEEK